MDGWDGWDGWMDGMDGWMGWLSLYDGLLRAPTVLISVHTSGHMSVRLDI